MKLNVLFSLLLVVVGFVIPGVAFGSGMVSHTGFGEIIIKVLSAFALITLATNGVAILAYKDRR
jgi:isoaspartyl peptidase/L-asparaginase-like protein (Ntn-hydrolase superfamily)